jgi:hypothetical protein
MKKTLFYFALSLLCIETSFAQVPDKMSYQAVIRNTTNALVSNSSVSIRISILQGSATGSGVYVETQTALTNSNGLLSIAIGTGTVVAGNFTTIDWSTGPYFIKTETDPLGGTAYSIAGTTQLMSVPYALYSSKSGSCNNVPNGNNTGDMQFWNGSKWVLVPAGSNGQILTFVNGAPAWGPACNSNAAVIKNLAITPIKAHGINFSWTSVTESNLISYRIDRNIINVDPSGFFSAIKTLPATGSGQNYTFNDPINNLVAVDYRLTAIFSDGSELLLNETDNINVIASDSATVNNFLVTYDGTFAHIKYTSILEWYVNLYHIQRLDPGASSFTNIIDISPIGPSNYSNDDFPSAGSGAYTYRLIVTFIDGNSKVLATSSQITVP